MTQSASGLKRVWRSGAELARRSVSRRSGSQPTLGNTSDILGLSFTVSHRYRPFALVSPGFEDLDDATPAVLASLVRAATGPTVPFVAIELSGVVADHSDVVAGLQGAGGDHVVAVFSPTRRQVSIEVRRDGVTTVVAQGRADLGTRFQAAFALCENQVTALVDSGDGWQPLATNRKWVAELVDLRDPGTLSEFSYYYGAGGSSGTGGSIGSVRVSGVKAGPFGMAGLRDPHLVQRPDGTPYIRDGLAYLTFTCAGLGFFQQAHWGVFTLDLADPTEVRQVAHLYTGRDGLVLGDHAGQVVVDEANARVIVLTSSWGDFAFDGVHVRHAVTTDDVLSGRHVLETARLDLPTEVSSWDPAATLIDDRWHVAFVESPSQKPFDFHPALSAGPPGGAYGEGLERVAADSSMRQCEGTIIVGVGDRWYLLASDGDARSYPVYDLSVHRLGDLDAPYGTNIPHPQIVERPGGGYLMVSFDGTPYADDVLGYGGHGDVVIMSSKPG